EAVVGRIEPRAKHEVRVRLSDGDTGVLNLLGKTALCGGHAVLYVNRSNVQVVAGAEGHIDAAGAVVGAGRGDVVHALDAIDLLLQRDGDRGLHHLCICPDVIAADVDLRRRQVRIERNWQRRNAHGSRKNYEECADRGKNRPLNEKVNQTRSSSPAPLITRSLLPIRWCCLACWSNGCTVDQELRARDDDLITGRQAAGHGIVIADGVAESYGAL